MKEKRYHGQKPLSRTTPHRMIRILRSGITCFALTCAAAAASAQISLITAVDLALKSSPRVLMAQADVDKALATWQQLRDAYIPTVVGGSGLGPPSYGFPLGQPSIFNITSQSLVFSYSQHDYLRAAQAALDATKLNLKDAREAVAEDTAVTYLALNRDLEREAALRDQQGYADRLVAIVQQRLDAGEDTPIGLTTSRLTAAQIKLARLRAEDDTVTDKAHLARLIGLPLRGITTTNESIPPFPSITNLSNSPLLTSPTVDSAYAVARSKRETAFGEARYLWRPQIYFTAEYSRFASYTNIQDYYSHFQHNNAAIGVQINVPLFDMVHRAKAREAAADASHALHEADMIRDQFLDTSLRASHTVAELSARADVANLDQQLAKQNLDVLMVQLKTGSGNLSGPQMTPKDEQSARIAEREKFVAVLNADFEAAQAQINLLRTAGRLEAWLAASVSAQPVKP
ncbi:MAG: TolC family protein [Edaphobacter sp.]